MDDTLHLDVYAEFSDANVFVTHETVGEAVVMVEIKSARSSGSIMNMLSLSMAHPSTVVELGKKLIQSGVELEILQDPEPLNPEERDVKRMRALESARMDIGAAVFRGA